MWFARGGFFVLALTVAACQSEDRCGPSTATVARVIDGDTVDLDSGERVRYLMVDAPEVSDGGECFGDEARTLNSELVLGQVVELRYDVECEDRYGRLLAYVYVQDREINSLLVERGYACMLYIPPNGAEYKLEFEGLESQARQQGRGLWAACEDTPC